MEDLRRKDIWISLLIFSISFAIYLKTLCPTLYVADSGELIASAYLLGIPHPPGFPLWCLLARLFTLIPIGNIAWRVNLSSAFFASCAVVLVYLIMRKTSNIIIPAIVTALLVAFSKCFWSIAVIAEVYTLLILFMLIAIFLLLLWQEKQESKYLYGACLIYGLSLTIHLSLLYLAPVFIFWVLLVNWRMIREVKQLTIMFLFFLLGLIVYLYLPLRSLANPPIDWGNPQTWERFLAHIMRRQYIKSSTSIVPGPLNYGFVLSKNIIQTSLNSIGTYFKIWSREIPVYISWLGLLGAVRMFKNNRRWFVITLVIFLFLGLAYAAVGKLKDVPDDFPIRFIPSFIVLTLWIGYGIECLWVKGKGYSERLGANPRTYRFLSALLILILPIFPLRNNYFFNDHSHHYLAYDYGMNILNTLDRDAILFIYGDNIAFSMAYLKLVENKRPDVTVYDRMGNLFEDIYGFYRTDKKWTKKEWVAQKNRVEREIATTTLRPVYYGTRKDISQIPDYELRVSGLVYRLVKKGSPLRKEPDYYSRYTLRGVDDEKVFKDIESNEIVAIYHHSLAQHYGMEKDFKQMMEEAKKASQAGWYTMEVHYNLGLMFQEYEMYDQAIESYERAIEINPDFTSAYDNLGVVYAKKGRFGEAIQNFEKAITLDPHFPSPHNNLGATYGEQGRYDEALKEFEEALKLDSDFLGVHCNMGLAYYKKGEYEKAGSEFKKVSRTDPNYRTARQYLRTLKKEKPR